MFDSNGETAAFTLKIEIKLTDFAFFNPPSWIFENAISGFRKVSCANETFLPSALPDNDPISNETKIGYDFVLGK